MARFFTRERFGTPQFLAGLLLLAFLAQCFLLISRGVMKTGVDSSEIYRVREGLRRWHGESAENSPSDTPAEIEDNEGYDPNLGARPLRRAVQRYIEDPLAEELLLGGFTSGDHILADMEGDDKKVIFKRVHPEGDGAEKKETAGSKK